MHIHEISNQIGIYNQYFLRSFQKYSLLKTKYLIVSSTIFISNDFYFI